jgi:lipopolysaccharide transport system ATP-binding protein
MSDPIIRVENLSKKYVLSHQAEGPSSFREVLAGTAKGLGKRLNPFRVKSAAELAQAQASQEEFWALKEISFEIQRGDRVGIIGRNGAGKSTLLKILSRITEPSYGEIRIRGRVASLLEVGTGFHGELSGRENIFLNGAILGMSKEEIKRKFDEIVEFSEVEKFLDTPVKRYSSGMYVRLAFAVAAHLEPEVLIVDEVLAVGDVPFQKKCIKKMEDVAVKEGRTVLFVSHNTQAIQQLTDKAIYLKKGELITSGPTDKVMDQYLSGMQAQTITRYDVESSPRPQSDLSRAVEFLQLELDNDTGTMVSANPSLQLKYTVRINEQVDDFRFAQVLSRINGTPVGISFSPKVEVDRTDKVATYRLSLPEMRLAPGIYYFTIAIIKGEYGKNYLDLDILDQVLQFEVLAPDSLDWAGASWFHGWGSIRFPEAKLTRVG